MNENESQPLLSNDDDIDERFENAVSLATYQQYTEPHDVYAANQNVQPAPLTFIQKASFGLGHIYNDLCAAMWFSYTLLFLQAVLDMKSTAAGSMLLLGQVMDALATPVVGVLADRWGSKRLWHLGGTILVLFSFPLIFSRCIGCWMSSTGTYLMWWQPFYYAIIIVIFQCGWAIVQISHLAMIPALTENLNERSELTAIRYTASVCAGVTVYIITWVVLRLENDNGLTIGPTDDYKFRDVALLLTVIGCIFSIIFHIGLRYQNKMDKRNAAIHKNRKKYHPANEVESSETPALKENGCTDNNFSLSSSNRHTENNTNNHNGIIIRQYYEKKNFFTSPILYQVALLYVASRLFSALGLVYMPLFLDERLKSKETTETVESIASVPLVSYVASFFASILLKYRNNCVNNKVLYAIGSAVSLISCMWVAIALHPLSGAFQLYSATALMGAGSSITMVSSLCITADLIGPHSDQGAVVYSVVTFADKLITGLAVVIIENYKCSSLENCPQYYRNILAYVCGGSALMGLITIIGGQFYYIKWCCRRK